MRDDALIAAVASVRAQGLRATAERVAEELGAEEGAVAQRLDVLVSAGRLNRMGPAYAEFVGSGSGATEVAAASYFPVGSTPT